MAQSHKSFCVAFFKKRLLPLIFHRLARRSAFDDFRMISSATAIRSTDAAALAPAFLSAPGARIVRNGREEFTKSPETTRAARKLKTPSRKT
jgi:hypothetical protein